MDRLTPEQRRAWTGFLKAYRDIVPALDAALIASDGLSLSAYDVLAKLSLAPDRQMRMAELADAVQLTRSGLTRLVEKLERDRLVSRSRGEVDCRQVHARLTGRGLERLAEATPNHLAGVRREFLERLSPQQMRRLAKVWDDIGA